MQSTQCQNQSLNPMTTHKNHKKYKKQKPNPIISTSQPNLNDFSSFYLKQSQDTQAAKQTLKLESKQPIPYRNSLHKIQYHIITQVNEANQRQNLRLTDPNYIKIHRQNTKYYHLPHSRNTTRISSQLHALPPKTPSLIKHQTTTRTPTNNPNDDTSPRRQNYYSFLITPTQIPTNRNPTIKGKQSHPPRLQLLPHSKNHSIKFNQSHSPPHNKNLLKILFNGNPASPISISYKKIQQRLYFNNLTLKKRKNKSQTKLSQNQQNSDSNRYFNEIKQKVFCPSPRIFQQHNLPSNMTSKLDNLLQVNSYKSDNKYQRLSPTKSLISSSSKPIHTQTTKNQQTNHTKTNTWLLSTSKTKDKTQLENKMQMKNYLAKLRNKNFNIIKQKIKMQQLLPPTKIGTILTKIDQNHYYQYKYL